MKDLSTEKVERTTLIEGLFQEASERLQQLNQKEKDSRKTEAGQQEKWMGLVYEEAALKKNL